MINSLRIKYVGHGTRLIGSYVWDEANSHVTTVDDVQIAANLLTYPRPEFELDASEPLLQTMTADEIVELVVMEATRGEIASSQENAPRNDNVK